MEFKKALNLKDKNQHLIGKFMDDNKIDEIALLPSKPDFQKMFINLYLKQLSGGIALLPFHGDDVEVIAIFDKAKIKLQSSFSYKNIFELPDHFNVVEN